MTFLKVLFSISFVSCLATAHAQIEFTAQNSVPAWGTYNCEVFQATGSGELDFIQTGEDVEWDFSALGWTSLGPIATNFQPASWTHFGYFFEDSNVCYWQEWDEGDQAFWYSEVREDSMMLSGTGYYWEDNASNAGPLCVPRAVWLRYPAGVGDSVLWPTYACGGYNVSDLREIIASGTLDLGNEVVEDVLLFRSTRVIDGNAFVSYGWYALGDAYFSVLSCDDIGYTFIRRTCSVIATSVAEAGSRGGIHVVPNPGVDHVRLVNADGGSLSGILSVYDMQGREVMRPTVLGSSVDISVSALQNGMYTAVIHDGTERRVQRFVVEH